MPLKYAFKTWRRRALVAEATILLLAARLLIGFVPLRLWRWSLGRQRLTEPASVDIAWPSVRAVTRAINRAADRSPIAMVCLPRAMATQWMLAVVALPRVLSSALRLPKPRKRRAGSTPGSRSTGTSS